VADEPRRAADEPPPSAGRHAAPVDAIRLGLSFRALRRRRGWTQRELGARAGVSPQAISRIERGEAEQLSVRLLQRVAAALGARIDMRVLWQGENLDRLLDHDHAHLVERALRWLGDSGWHASPEVTFQIGSERGSIDILAWHPPTQTLPVIEVKSVVPDVQATLAGMDRKARLAPRVALDRGWKARGTSRILILPDDRTARRRVAAFSSTFDQAFPARTAEVRRWAKKPDAQISGVVFVSDPTHMGARHRVAPTRSRAERGRAAPS
jgi:transcriptional regulator with XRE-family HTH domain